MAGGEAGTPKASGEAPRDFFYRETGQHARSDGGSGRSPPSQLASTENASLARGRRAGRGEGARFSAGMRPAR